MAKEIPIPPVPKSTASSLSPMVEALAKAQYREDVAPLVQVCVDKVKSLEASVVAAKQELDDSITLLNRLPPRPEPQP